MKEFDQIEEFIRYAPKAELHLHIEGTLEPELMFELAKRKGLKLKYNSLEEIHKAYEFNDLQSFLDIYYEGTNVLTEEQDFYALTWAYLQRMNDENVSHVEIFFDPQTHTDRGIPFEVVYQGISKALKNAETQFGITNRLILCFLRHLSEEAAFKTLKQAEPFLEGIRAVGLDSSEKDNPPSKFERVFKKSREMGLKTVAHAGEEAGADYIIEALDLLKVSRIDHGVRSDEDGALIKRLVDEKMPLTVCPLSNVSLGVFKNLKDHNLKKLLDSGLCVTVNSDDPAYFGGYLTENYLQTVKALDISLDEVKTLIKNSFEASFLSDVEKKDWILKINNLLL